MTAIWDGVIRGELSVALLLACICMGTYLGRGNR